VFRWVPSFPRIDPSISYALFISRGCKIAVSSTNHFHLFFFLSTLLSSTVSSLWTIRYRAQKGGNTNPLGEILCFYHHQFSIQFSLSFLVSLLSFIFSFYTQEILCKFFFFVYVKWSNIISASFCAPPPKKKSLTNFCVHMRNPIYQTFGYMQSYLFKPNVLISISIVWLLCISEFRRNGGGAGGVLTGACQLKTAAI
jgi:hypothetical protein